MLTATQVDRARTAAEAICISLGSLYLMNDYGFDPSLPTVAAEEAEARRHFEAIASALGYRVERIAPVNREAITARVAVGAVNLAEAV